MKCDICAHWGINRDAEFQSTYRDGSRVLLCVSDSKGWTAGRLEAVQVPARNPFPFVDEAERVNFEADVASVSALVTETDWGIDAGRAATTLARKYTYPVVVRDMFSSAINRSVRKFVNEANAWS